MDNVHEHEDDTPRDDVRHRFADDVAELLLHALHQLAEAGFVARDDENVWVTTKKFRAEIVMRKLRKDNGT